ncbi:AcrR family transcriptional regulator [Leucobacter exalbidus]|uniref:AcrR family transcriptional regulator n=1 Tax=Leucobacter exalbidus TaxID=662960 RepID=A0A940PV88_9MICO|nr:TetR/AcrR family transcriptional regulator [Leucobacter exalbidus]MBP1327463.1 AcrR family transcriptional regulator [Leucobacter exalbidus]
MTTQRPGRPRSSSPDEVRDIAFGLFAKNGYAATSLAEIARAAGISRTTLFSYVPAKRDLVWDELDERLELALTGLTANREQSPVDAIVDALLALARHGISEHDALAERWNIVREDQELRASLMQRSEELAVHLARGVRELAPAADVELTDHVVRALLAVSTNCTEAWAQLPTVTMSLDEYTAIQLQPFADALRPLLEGQSDH